MQKVLKKQEKPTTILNFDNYQEGINEYIYYIMGCWHARHHLQSEILLRAVAYNFVEFRLQKNKREGKSIQDYLNAKGVGVEVAIEQAYLELARAVADDKYKMQSMYTQILPAKKILPTLYSNLKTEIEELRETIQREHPYYRDIEI